jgi:hypothetical protein
MQWNSLYYEVDAYHWGIRGTVVNGPPADQRFFLYTSNFGNYQTAGGQFTPLSNSSTKDLIANLSYNYANQTFAFWVKWPPSADVTWFSLGVSYAVRIAYFVPPPAGIAAISCVTGTVHDDGSWSSTFNPPVPSTYALALLPYSDNTPPSDVPIATDFLTQISSSVPDISMTLGSDNIFTVTTTVATADTAFTVWAANPDMSTFYNLYTVRKPPFIAPHPLQTDALVLTRSVGFKDVFSALHFGGVPAAFSTSGFGLSHAGSPYDVTNSLSSCITSRNGDWMSFGFAVDMSVVNTTEAYAPGVYEFVLWFKDSLNSAVQFKRYALQVSTLYASNVTHALVPRFRGPVTLGNITTDGSNVVVKVLDSTRPSGEWLSPAAFAPGFQLALISSVLTVTIDVGVITNAYLRSNVAQTFTVWAYDDTTPPKSMLTFAVQQPSTISPAQGASVISLNVFNDWFDTVVYSGLASNADFFVVGNSDVVVTFTDTRVTVSAITLREAGATFALWWSDDHTAPTLWRSYVVMPRNAALNPSWQTNTTLNRLDAWCVTYAGVQYAGTHPDTFTAYLVPATDTGDVANALSGIVTVTPTASIGTYDIIVNMQPLVQTAVGTFHLYWSDASTDPVPFVKITVPGTCSIVTAVATTTPALRFANPFSLFTGVYTGSALTSLSWFVIPTNGDATALTSAGGLSVEVDGSGMSRGISVNIDASVITNGYLTAHTTQLFQVYAYDDNTAPFPINTSFSIRQSSTISPAAGSTVRLRHTNNWSVSIVVSGVDAASTAASAVDSSTRTAISDLLRWDATTATLYVVAADDHPIRASGGDFTVLLSDTFSTSMDWKTFTIPAPSTLSPAITARATLNRVNNWQVTFANLQYAGAAFSSLTAYATLENDSTPIPDVLTVTKTSLTQNVTFTVNALSLVATTTETYQLWWSDDDRDDTVLVNMLLPGTSSLTWTSANVSPVRRFSKQLLFSGVYAGTVRSSFSMFAAPVGEEPVVAVTGLLVTPNTSTALRFNAEVTVDTTIFTNAYLRAHASDSYQMYGYDDNTAPFAINAPFTLHQPSIMSPTASITTTQLNRLNAWGQATTYAGLDVATVQFYALPVGSATSTAAIAGVLSSTDTVLSVSVSDAAHPLRAVGGSFVVWWEDAFTSLSQWSAFSIPAPSTLSGGDGAAALLSLGNVWQHQFSGGIAYTGDTFTDLYAYVVVGTTEHACVATGTTSSVTIAVDMRAVVPASDTTFTVWWRDYKTAPVAFATVAVAGKSTITVSTVTAVVSRILDPADLCTAVYGGGVDVRSSLRFIALPSTDAPWTSYVGATGMVVLVDTALHVTVNIDESIFTNAAVLAAPHATYQLLAYDDHTPLEPLGAPFAIEQPSVLSIAASSTAVPLRADADWSLAISFAGGDADTIRFFTDVASTVATVTNTASSVTVVASVPVQHGQGFGLFWEDKETTATPWRLFTIPYESTLAPSSTGTDAIALNSRNDWTWSAAATYAGTSFDELGLYLLPASAVVFSSADAVAIATDISRAGDVTTLTANLQNAVTTVPATYRLWWKDAYTVPKVYATFAVQPRSIIVLSSATTTNPVGRFSPVSLLSATYNGTARSTLTVVAIATHASFQRSGTTGLVLSVTDSEVTSGVFDVTASVDTATFTNTYLLAHTTETFQAYVFDDNTPPTPLGSPFGLRQPSVMTTSGTVAIVLNTANSFTTTVSYSGVDVDTVQFYVLLEDSTDVSTALTGVSNSTRTTFTIHVPSDEAPGTDLYVWWSDARTTPTVWQHFVVPPPSTISTPAGMGSTSIFRAPSWSSSLTGLVYTGYAFADMHFRALPADATSYSTSAANGVTGYTVVISGTAAAFALTADFTTKAAALATSASFKLWWFDAYTTPRPLAHIFDVAEPSVFTCTLAGNNVLAFPNNLLILVGFSGYDDAATTVQCVATSPLVTQASLALTNARTGFTFTHQLVSTYPVTKALNVTCALDSGKAVWFRANNFRDWYFEEDGETEFNLWIYDDYSQPLLVNTTGVFTTRPVVVQLNRSNNWAYDLTFAYTGLLHKLLFTMTTPNLTTDFAHTFLTRPTSTSIRVSIPSAMLRALSGIRFYMYQTEDETSTSIVDYETAPYTGKFLFKIFDVSIDNTMDDVELQVVPSLSSSQLTSSTSTTTSVASYATLNVSQLKSGTTAAPTSAFTLWAYDVNTPLFQVSSAVYSFTYPSKITLSSGPTHFALGLGVVLFDTLTYIGSTLNSLAFAPCAYNATAYVPHAGLQAVVTLRHSLQSDGSIQLKADIADGIFNLFPDGTLPKFKIWGMDDNTSAGIALDRVLYVDRTSPLTFTVTSDVVLLSGANYWTDASIHVQSQGDTMVACAAPAAVTAESFNPAAPLAGVICSVNSSGSVTVTADPFSMSESFHIWVRTATGDDRVPATRIPTVFSMQSAILQNTVRVAGTGDLPCDQRLSLLTTTYTGTSIVRFVALPVDQLFSSVSVPGIVLAYLDGVVAATVQGSVFTLAYFHAGGAASFVIWAYEATSSVVFRIPEVFNILRPSSSIVVSGTSPAKLLPNGVATTLVGIQYTGCRPGDQLAAVGTIGSMPFSTMAAPQGLDFTVTNTYVRLSVRADFYALNNLPTTADATVRLWLYDESTHIAITTTPIPVVLMAPLWELSMTKFPRDRSISQAVATVFYKGGRTLVVDARPAVGVFVAVKASTLTADEYDVSVVIDDAVFNAVYFLNTANPRTFSLYAYDSVLPARVISNSYAIVPPKSRMVFGAAGVHALQARIVYAYTTVKLLRDQTFVDVATLYYQSSTASDTLVAAVTSSDVEEFVPGTTPTLLHVGVQFPVAAGTIADGTRQITLNVTGTDVVQYYSYDLRLRLWIYDDNTPPDVNSTMLLKLVVPSTIELHGAQLCTRVLTGKTGVALFDVDYTGVAQSSLLLTASIPGVWLTPEWTDDGLLRVLASVDETIWVQNEVSPGQVLYFTVSATDDNTDAVALGAPFTVGNVFEVQAILQTDVTLLDDVPVLDVVYYGVVAPADITARVVSTVYNACTPGVTPVMPGITARLLTDERQWRVWVTVDSTAAANFSADVDEVYFDLWAFEAGASGGTRLTLNAFSLTSTLVVQQLTDTNGTVVTNGKVSLFPFNTTASVTTPLVATLWVYGGKAFDNQANAFNTYIRQSGAAASFPNALRMEQRSPDGLPGVTLVDIFTTTSGLDSTTTYAKDFKVVIVDKLGRMASTSVHFVCRRLEVVALLISGDAPSIYSHQYNGHTAFSVPSTFTDRVLIGTVVMNGTAVDETETETSITGFDADVFETQGAHVYVRARAVNTSLKDCSNFSVAYDGHVFTVPVQHVYAYPALEITGVSTATTTVAESALAAVSIVFSLSGGIGTYDAASTYTALTTPLPSVHFVEDTASTSITISTVTKSSNSVTLSALALTAALPTPTGGNTRCTRSLLALNITHYGRTVENADVHASVLVYSDIVPIRTQLLRFGCLGTETQVYMRRSTALFPVEAIVAGGYLDAAARVVLRTSPAFIATGLVITAAAAASGSLTFAYVDGKGTTTADAQFTVSTVPDTVFGDLVRTRYLCYPVGSGTDAGRNLYVHGDDEYALPRPSLTNASVTQTSVQKTPYDGSEVVTRVWEDTTLSVSTANADAFMISADGLDDAYMYGVNIQCVETALPEQQLFVQDDALLTTDAYTLAEVTYTYQLLVEDRTLNITPSGQAFDGSKIGVNYLGTSDASAYIDYSPVTEEKEGYIALGPASRLPADMVLMHNVTSALFSVSNAKLYDSLTMAIVPSSYTFTTADALKSAFFDTALQFSTAAGAISNVIVTNNVGSIRGTRLLMWDVVAVVSLQPMAVTQTFTLYFVHDVYGDVRFVQTHDFTFFANALVQADDCVLTRLTDVSDQFPDRLRLDAQLLRLPDALLLVYALQCREEAGTDSAWHDLASNRSDADSGAPWSDVLALLRGSTWPERGAFMTPVQFETTGTLQYRLCLQTATVSRTVPSSTLVSSALLSVSTWRDVSRSWKQLGDFIFRATGGDYTYHRLVTTDAGTMNGMQHSSRFVSSSDGLKYLTF